MSASPPDAAAERCGGAHSTMLPSAIAAISAGRCFCWRLRAVVRFTQPPEKQHACDCWRCTSCATAVVPMDKILADGV